MSGCAGKEAMLTKERTINVLGTDIQVLFRKEQEDPALENCNGYFDSSLKRIVVKIPEEDKMSLGNLEVYQKKVLRHEILHAFLHESGLDYSTSPAESWATSEEMVDWFAIQSPKIYKVFSEQGLL